MRANLFIIGASKCGTTFLHDVLAQHPQICMSLVKEPWFFNDDEWESKLDYYESIFSHCNSQIYRGEASPTYSDTTYFPDIPDRIFKFNSNSRIIYLVREPFSRLESVYKQAMSTGHWAERKFYKVKMPLSYRDAVFDYPPFLEATRYWTHVQNYRKNFPDKAIKVIRFEDLAFRTRETTKDLFDFLNIEKSVVIDVNKLKKNESKGKTAYNPWPARVKRLVPNLLHPLLGRQARRTVRRMLAALPVPQLDHPPLNAADKERIRQFLNPEIKGIYDYMGIEDDPWAFFTPEQEVGDAK